MIRQSRILINLFEFTMNNLKGSNF